MDAAFRGTRTFLGSDIEPLYERLDWKGCREVDGDVATNSRQKDDRNLRRVMMYCNSRSSSLDIVENSPSLSSKGILLFKYSLADMRRMACFSLSHEISWTEDSFGLLPWSRGVSSDESVRQSCVGPLSRHLLLP